jgi:Uma2 family endonuclease
MAQAAHAPASRRTRQEWLAWEEAQPERYELLWDEPTLMAGGTDRHAGIAVNVAALLRERLRGTPCRVRTDLKVGLPDGRWVYPDVFVRCTPRGGTETLIDDPVLVVEVLSPGTLIYNTSEKRWAYQGLPSLRHLLVVAQDQAKVEVASRDPDGTWRSVFHIGLDAELHLAAFDINLPLAGIYEDIEFPATASADSAQSEAPNESSTTAAKA